MKKILPLPIILLATSILHAQTVPPALMVQEGEKSQPLGISKIDIRVRILGYIAETTTTMTFTNPHDRVLQGDLYFPLPEGATVSGYALDIGGRMIDGVAVEKDKGREVFEKIVRESIDPGLIEWTRGNNFKTRVFPIPAQGSRTIRLSYVTERSGTPSASFPCGWKSSSRCPPRWLNRAIWPTSGSCGGKTASWPKRR